MTALQSHQLVRLAPIAYLRAKHGSRSTLPPVNGGFSWLSRYLIAAFGNVASIGTGNAKMILKLCSRLGSPRAS